MIIEIVIEIAIEIAIEIYYSNLTLYFLILTAIKNTVIPIRMSVSFQIAPSVAPFNKTALIMIINHLAGIILLIT